MQYRYVARALPPYVVQSCGKRRAVLVHAAHYGGSRRDGCPRGGCRGGVIKIKPRPAAGLPQLAASRSQTASPVLLLVGAKAREYSSTYDYRYSELTSISRYSNQNENETKLLILRTAPTLHYFTPGAGPSTASIPLHFISLCGVQSSTGNPLMGRLLPILRTAPTLHYFTPGARPSTASILYLVPVPR